MSPRSFFLILIKVVGLLTIKDLWFAGGTLIQNIMFYRGDEYSDRAGLWYVILSAVLVIGLVLLMYTLIFRPVIILDKLNLDEGFYDERFSFKMDQEAVLKIAILAVSIYIVVAEIPQICSYIAQYYSYRRTFGEELRPQLNQFVFSAAKIVTAGVLIGNHKFLARYIVGKTQGEENEE